MSLASRGDPVTNTFLDFVRALEPEVPDRDVIYGGSLALLGLEIGEIFDANGSISAATNSVCRGTAVSPSSSTTSSTTSTTISSKTSTTSSTSPPDDPGARLKSFGVEHGSYVFTVEVEGNGRELATAENTRWYLLRFTVTTSNGSFVVDARWSGNRDFRGRAYLGADLADLIVDAGVTGEWLADDTLVVVADNLGIDEEPVSAIVEITVRVTNDSGGNTDYDDTLTWEP